MPIATTIRQAYRELSQLCFSPNPQSAIALATAATGKRTTKYPAWTKTAAGRMYLDLAELLRSRRSWSSVATWMCEKDPVAGKALRQLMDTHGEQIIREKGGLKIPKRLILRIMPGMVGRSLYSYLASPSDDGEIVLVAELDGVLGNAGAGHHQ